MHATAIRIAATRAGHTLRQIGEAAEIKTRRWYRLIEGLAVPSKEELARVAAATGLSVDEVRSALPASAEGRDGAAV